MINNSHLPFSRNTDHNRENHIEIRSVVLKKIGHKENGPLILRIDFTYGRLYSIIQRGQSLA